MVGKIGRNLTWRILQRSEAHFADCTSALLLNVPHNYRAGKNGPNFENLKSCQEERPLKVACWTESNQSRLEQSDASKGVTDWIIWKWK